MFVNKAEHNYELNTKPFKEVKLPLNEGSPDQSDLCDLEVQSPAIERGKPSYVQVARNHSQKWRKPPSEVKRLVACNCVKWAINLC